MKQTEYRTIKLEADEGMKLTQAYDVEPLERVVADTVYVGEHDTPDNWVEITAGQGDAILNAQRVLELEREGEVADE